MSTMTSAARDGDIMTLVSGGPFEVAKVYLVFCELGPSLSPEAEVPVERLRSYVRDSWSYVHGSESGPKVKMAMAGTTIVLCR